MTSAAHDGDKANREKPGFVTDIFRREPSHSMKDSRRMARRRARALLYSGPDPWRQEHNRY